MYTLYALKEQGKVFWIGVTKNLKRRTQQHKEMWGGHIDVEPLQSDIPTQLEANMAEYHTIMKYKGLGYKLQNAEVRYNPLKE